MTLAKDCLACGGQSLESFYSVTSLPVHSCLMVSDRAQALEFPRGELELQHCPDCGFIQNGRFEPEKENYSADYEETQAFSGRFMRFLEELCEDQATRHDLAGKTLLEIGCGKGEFLVTLCEKAPGARGLGLDPGYHPERTTSPAAERIEFICDFYGPKYGHLKADYVSCRHTLEHIPDVLDFMHLVRRSIGDREDVVVFFELPDMERVLVDGAFWDIYYEHCSYFTEEALTRLFHRTGFAVTRTWKDYDDQYLMLEARPVAADTAIMTNGPAERTAAQVSAFKDSVSARLDELKKQVVDWKAAGRKIAVWGSGSKAVAFLTTLALDKEIDAVVDINPHKHGKFLAGLGHEIVGPAALEELRPDVVLVMNAIYNEEIRADLAKRGLHPELVGL